MNYKQYKLYWWFRKKYIRTIYIFKKKTTYSICIDELIRRPVMNSNYFGFMAKMSDEEIRVMNTEIDKMVYEQGTPNRFPDHNVAALAKLIDRDILYNIMTMELRKTYVDNPVNPNYYQIIKIDMDTDIDENQIKNIKDKW